MRYNESKAYLRTRLHAISTINKRTLIFEPGIAASFSVPIIQLRVGSADRCRGAAFTLNTRTQGTEQKDRKHITKLARLLFLYSEYLELQTKNELVPSSAIFLHNRLPSREWQHRE